MNRLLEHNLRFAHETHLTAFETEGGWYVNGKFYDQYGKYESFWIFQSLPPHSYEEEPRRLFSTDELRELLKSGAIQRLDFVDKNNVAVVAINE